MMVLPQALMTYRNYQATCEGTQSDAAELRCTVQVDRVWSVRVTGYSPAGNTEPFDCRVEGSGPNDGRWLDPVSFGDAGMFPSERTCLRTRQPRVFEGEHMVGALKAQTREVNNNLEGDGNFERLRGPWAYHGAGSDFVQLDMSALDDDPRTAVFGDSGANDGLSFDDGVASRRKRSGAHVDQVCFSADVAGLFASTAGETSGEQRRPGDMLAHQQWWRGFFRNIGIPETGFQSWCVANPNGPGTLQADAVTDVAEWARIHKRVRDERSRLVRQSDGSFVVPVDWGLKPAGVGAGERFRLLVVTSAKRDATSSDIADYDAHVRDAVRYGRIEVRGHASAWQAVASTPSVDARVHTRTRVSDTPAQVWWLNGVRVSSDYSNNSATIVSARAGFWSQGWELTLRNGVRSRSWDLSAVRDENGQSYPTDVGPGREGIWTGSDFFGTRIRARSLGAGDTAASGSHFVPGVINYSPVFSLYEPVDKKLRLYGLSPVYVVEGQQPAQQQPAQQQQAQQSPQDEQPPAYTPPAGLISGVRGYAAETQHGDAHVERWNRVLVAFGETVAGFGGTPMGAAEAQTYADRGWGRWVPVVAALEALEQAQS
ncbi:MAG: hypothetical protein OXF00_04390 [bacterium]|nr:hypothetical protein [bacterium]